MRVHLAEAGNYIESFIEKKYLTNIKFNILFSFAYNKKIETYQENAKYLLVDSGAFTFQQKGINKLDKYMKEYMQFIDENKKYENTYFIEMDIDNIIGYSKVLDIRQSLFEITNKIIPIWHRSLGVPEYKKMCKEYSYIGFSGVNKEDLLNTNQMRSFVEYAHKHNTKVHGLGVGARKTLLSVPFDSVDATSWLKATRFGSYNNKKLSSKYSRKNYKKIALLELIQGIKTAQFYENYWKNYNGGKKQ